MDIAEIRKGLLSGRTLVQEEWSDAADIAAVDALIEEGVAAATPWQYKDGFQCERRLVTAKK